MEKGKGETRFDTLRTIPFREAQVQSIENGRITKIYRGTRKKEDENRPKYNVKSQLAVNYIVTFYDIV